MPASSNAAILPMLTSGHALLAYAAAFVAYLSYKVYLFVRVPSQLRHIPRMPIWSYITEVYHGYSFKEGYERLRSQLSVDPNCEKPAVETYLRRGRTEWVVHLANGDDARQYFAMTDVFAKVLPTDLSPGSLFARFNTKNIVFSDTADWRVHRRAVNPAFHRAWSTTAFGECAHRALSRIESQKGVVDIAELMSGLTIDALGMVAFDTEFGAVDDPGTRFVALYKELFTAFSNPVYVLLSVLDRQWNPLRRKYFEKMDQLDAAFFDMYSRKREQILKHGIPDKSEADLLSLLIQANEQPHGANEKDGFTSDAKAIDVQPSLTLEDINSNMRIFFLAGHDTTANSLACVITELAKHPEIQEHARQHVISVLGNDDPTHTPSYEEQKKLTYLTMLIKETLRMYPSVTFIPPRRANKDVQLPHTFIPKGTLVQVSPWAIHRNNAHWENPEVFDPMRFKDEPNDMVVSQATTGWVPFGGGKRACIGFMFSMIEQRVVLAALLRKFTWTISDQGNADLVFPNSALIQPINMKIKFTPLN